MDIVQLVDAHGSEIRSTDPELTLPHPFAHERAFVLIPWLEADPAATLNGRGVQEYIDKLGADEVAGVRSLGDMDTLLGRADFAADSTGSAP